MLYKMRQKGLFISILLTTVHHSWVREIPTSSTEDSELKFFQRIQGLNLDWEDILDSYKNVSAEVETPLCKSKCKTTMALWVLQNLSPCDSIERLDCPTGLVCCGKADVTQNPKDTNNDKAFSADDRIANEKPTTSVSYVPFFDETGQELYYPELILDPIPNDESSEILKV